MQKQDALRGKSRLTEELDNLGEWLEKWQEMQDFPQKKKLHV